VGKGWCNYLDISVKSNYLDFRSKILDFKTVSKSVIDRKTTLVGYSFFDNFVEFVNLIKVYQYRQVDITEERGSLHPHPTDQGEERPGRFGRWGTAFFRLVSALTILVSVTQVLELFQRLPVSDGLSPMPPTGAGGVIYCIPSFSGQKYGFSGPWSGLFLVWVHLPCFVFPESRI